MIEEVHEPAAREQPAADQAESNPEAQGAYSQFNNSEQAKPGKTFPKRKRADFYRMHDINEQEHEQLPSMQPTSGKR